MTKVLKLDYLKVKNIEQRNALDDIWYSNNSDILIIIGKKYDCDKYVKKYINNKLYGIKFELNER